jgi:hypothetical protein
MEAQVFRTIRGDANEKHRRNRNLSSGKYL